MRQFIFEIRIKDKFKCHHASPKWKFKRALHRCICKLIKVSTVLLTSVGLGNM